MRESEDLNVLLLEEMLRRKGHIIESVKKLGRHWYTVLTWTKDEEADFEKWALARLKQHGYNATRARSAFGMWNLNYGLRVE